MIKRYDWKPEFGIVENRDGPYVLYSEHIAALAALSDYDAGLLNDFGGGNVEWWQDYIRAEIGRANDFWREQVSSAPPHPAMQESVAVRALEWSEPRKPDGKESFYDHCIATSPLGEYRIEWKSWKGEGDGYGIDSTLGWVGCEYSLDAAKAASQADYEQRIRTALSAAPSPARETAPNLEEIIRAGAGMANALYGLAQEDYIPSNIREIIKGQQQEWDDARAATGRSL